MVTTDANGNRNYCLLSEADEKKQFVISPERLMLIAAESLTMKEMRARILAEADLEYTEACRDYYRAHHKRKAKAMGAAL